MSSWLTALGAAGIICSLAALAGTGMVLVQQGKWPMALACLAGMATIIFLVLVGLEFADEFWKGRS